MYPNSELILPWPIWTRLIYVAGTIAFATTAVLAINKAKEIDILGATFLGIITAIGGGTIRDVILDAPVFWSQDLSFIYVATGASLVAFYWRKLFKDRLLYRPMLYLDGFGASIFAIQAAAKVWDLGFGKPVAPVILGVITGIGGGLMRDVLTGQATLLMRREIYATPLLLGCCAFVLILNFLPNYRTIGAMLCISATILLRAAAIHWNFALPKFTRYEPN